MSSTQYEDDRLRTVSLLLETSAALRSVLSPPIVAAGLSESAFEVMLRLAQTPDGRLRMTDLASQTALSTSGVTRLVDRLEQEGLIERVLCQEDRRGLWARLTPEGQGRIDSLLPQHLEIIDALVTSHLDAAALTALRDSLQRLRDGVAADEAVVLAAG